VKKNLCFLLLYNKITVSSTVFFKKMKNKAKKKKVLKKGGKDGILEMSDCFFEIRRPLPLIFRKERIFV